jgi:DNA-binding HxlR family transcriptional regulator
VLGDTWSLLIIRDLVFGDARHFRELLRGPEGISSNVLADRLKKLVAQGLITAADDPAHKQKTIYSLTEMGIALVPTLVNLGQWGRRFLPATDELSARIEVLEGGGPRMWEQFMDELRVRHLGAVVRRRPRGPSVHEQLEQAYAAVVSGAD